MAKNDAKCRLTFYTTYIFLALFWRLAEILILLVVIPTLVKEVAATPGSISTFESRHPEAVNVIDIALGFVTLLTTAGFALTVAEVALLIHNGAAYTASSYFKIVRAQG
jgi:hypothetical protein